MNHAGAEGTSRCYKNRVCTVHARRPTQAFLEKVKADPELQQKIKESKFEGCIVDLAKQTGFSIAMDDLIDVDLGLDSQPVTELSNEEINRVED